MMRQLGLLIVLACLMPFANGAQVLKIKGSNALLNMQGESAVPGDSFLAIDSNGKKMARIKIVKINGDKAIGKILKGTAAGGMTLQREAAGAGGSGGSTKSVGGAKKTHKSKAAASSSTADGRSYWGVLLGVAQDQMAVNVNSYTTGESLGTSALSGIGFSLKGLFDYELFPQVWFRGTTGIEQFNSSGSSHCGTGNLQACDAKIMYFSLDFLARYVFFNGSFRPWGGAGVGLLFPASKSATALSSSSIGTTNVIMVAGGFDYFISPAMYIPVSIEYGVLPKSNEVDAHWVELRFGLGIPF